MKGYSVFDSFFKHSVNNCNKNKSDNSFFYCKFALNGMIFFQNEIVSACIKNHPDFILDNDYNSLYLNVNNVNNQKKIIQYNFLSNSPGEKCLNCVYLGKNAKKVTDNSVKYLYLSHWQCCFLNCSYCDNQKNDDLDNIKHYDIMPVLEQLIDNKIINKETKIIFGCGDASLHAETDKIIYFLINYGFKDIEFNISGQRYCYPVAEAIGKNIAKVIISIDCGCSYVYEKIKSKNKFDIMIETTKRYLEFQNKGNKNVIYKYTVIQGINDNKKEVLDWFILSGNLGINKLIFDIDKKWFENVRNEIPQHLKDIILFVDGLSEINNYDIEFSKEIEYLYNKITGNKKRKHVCI